MTSITRDSTANPLSFSSETDPIELFALADRADWALLRMVSCVAIATLLLAAASSLMA